MEPDHLAADIGHIRLHLAPLHAAGAAEDDVVEVVDGAGLWLGFVGGGVSHHVGPHGKVQLPAGKDLAQAVQIVAVGKVHRDIMGEEVHVKLVGHGHTDDLAAQQGGLGLLGPGEFVNGQVHLKAQVPDLLDDALVGEGEGIEGAGEEGHLPVVVKGEGVAFDAVADDKAVDVGQGRRGIEEGQLLLLLLVDEEEDLLSHQEEEALLVLVGKGLGGEKALPQDPQGLLAHRLLAGGKALEQKPRHFAPAGGEDLLALAEALAVDGVVLQHGAHGGKGGRHHAGIGGGEQGEELLDDLVQLPGGQPQDELAQVLGDILGQLRLAGLQRLGHLHGNLITAGGGQGVGHGKQGRAGHAAHRHGLADLHEVGEVGGDMEDVGLGAVDHLLAQVLHTRGLQHPGGGGLQVIQKHAAHRLRLVQNLPIGGGIQSQAPAQLGLEEQKGRAAGAVGLLGGLNDHLPLGVVLRHGGDQMAEQPQRRRLLGIAAVFQPPPGKADQLGAVLPAQALHGHVQHRIHQGEGLVRLHGLRVLIMAQEDLRKAEEVGVGAVVQQGVRHGLGLVTDLPGLQGGKAPVGVDHLFQVLVPKDKGPVLLGTGGRAGGQLLFIAGLEAGQDAADEGGSLADVAVGEQQQLIEELQGLLLLSRAPIGEILLEDGQVRPDAGGLLLRAGGLQDGHEEPVMAQAVHQVDVVVHGGVAEGRHHFLLRHQRGVPPGLGGGAGRGQGGVHAEGDHVLLKVAELGVDILVAAALGVIHIVQLAQNDVEGFLQGEDLGDLPAVLSPGLLHAEIRVHQHQGLGGEVFDLKVPDRVVGGDAAQGGKAVVGAPLVGIEIMEVGDPLPGLAAEFADVVGGGGAGDKAQVNEAPLLAEGPGDGDGHMVDPRDMLQGAEGRHLPAQAQQLVDVLLPEALQKEAVFVGNIAAGQLLFRAEGKVQPGVKGQNGPLSVKQGAQELQKAQCAVLLGGRMAPVIHRVEDGGSRLIGIGQPALPGLGRDGVQQGAEGRQRLGAGKAVLNGQKGIDQPLPVHILKQARHIRPVAVQLSQEGFLREALRQVHIQGTAFHKGPPFRPKAGVFFSIPHRRKRGKSRWGKIFPVPSFSRAVRKKTSAPHCSRTDFMIS